MTNAELAAKVAELTAKIDGMEKGGASFDDSELKAQIAQQAEHIQSLEERIAVLDQEKVSAYDDAALVARVEALENSKLPAGAIDLWSEAERVFMHDWISTVLHKYHANDMPEQLPVSDPMADAE